jgi:PAS domain-containing protein
VVILAPALRGCAVIGKAELGALFDGLRAAVTISDQDFQISFMNDRAIVFYAKDGGAELIGKNLLDCHTAEQQAVLRQAYARYRAGDFTPTRYRAQKEDGAPESIVHIPLMVEGQFRGVAELIWNERSDLVFGG